MDLAWQFSYDLPQNWTTYLFGLVDLERFRFYPLILGILGLVFLIAVAALLMARLKKGNRPLSKFLKLIGKTAFAEVLVGAFLLFSRWQTLGFMAMRIFLLLWIVSLPIVAALMFFLFLRKFRGKVHEATEKVSLSKYMPGKKR